MQKWLINWKHDVAPYQRLAPLSCHPPPSKNIPLRQKAFSLTITLLHKYLFCFL